MARKGIFGSFGSRKEKEEPKVVEGEPRKEELAKDRADIFKKKEKMLNEQAPKKVIKKHVVVSGDTLSGIAKKYYDDAGKYMVIYKANKELIGDNPDLIQPGMDLIIPEL